MKRTVLSYVFTLAVILFSFSAVYSIQFNRLKQELMNQGNSDADQQSSDEATEGNDRELAENETDDQSSERDETSEQTDSEDESSAKEADANDELRTNSSMIYVVGQYDWDTGTVTETVEKFPKELLDLTRQELLVYLREHPEYGSLLSFSEHAVYLRKSDHADWSEYLYFLTIRDGELKVYRLEDDRLYLNTGIKTEELSEENCELLSEGLYIKDNAALFDYLQTVTS